MTKKRCFLINAVATGALLKYKVFWFTRFINFITLLALNTPAHITPALIPPRENFDLPLFRAAFNGKIQKKGKVFNLQ